MIRKPRMQSPSPREPDQLPEYAEEMAFFHRAFAYELRAIVAGLPLGPEMHILDAGCGDGFYSALLADRLVPPGRVTGIDVSSAFLAQAERRCAYAERVVEFVHGDLEALGGGSREFDFVWCAQSLYSLPDPVEALEQMSRVLKSGGFIAVLENDTLHQVLLPWPCQLEIVVRAAEFADLV